MAVSVYDETKLTDQQKADIERYKQAFSEAQARGDREGMDSAHAAAESVRAQAGYSGGADGSRYLPTGGGTSGAGTSYTPAQLPGYEAQTDAVNKLYDAAREAQLAQLKSAFDANSATLEAERAEIPVVYQAQKNAAAGQSELAGRNFNEYAAASGLNTGTAGQAALARSNQLQGDLSALGRQEAADTRALDSKLAQLKIQYQNDISAAIAQGEYDRAAALLQEYQRAAESAVTVAQAQADENYRAWSANNSNAQWREQFDYGKEQDALAQKQWQQQFDYGKSQDELTRQQWEREFAAQQDEADWERRYKEALAKAQYGAAVPAAGTVAGDTATNSGPVDLEPDGTLVAGSPAQTLEGLIRNVPGRYTDYLDRIEAGVRSGEISERAGNYLLDLLESGAVYDGRGQYVPSPRPGKTGNMVAFG